LLVDHTSNIVCKPTDTNCMAFQTLVAKIVDLGTVSWPFQVLLHSITRESKSSNERTRFTIKSTHEKSWMTVAKKNDTTEECNNKVTWANVFNHVSDMDA
jgi:hypothetical protein